MKYRKFGSLDYDASILGFGCMRLPVINGDASKIDEPEAAKLVRYAIDNGVNYIDTAYPYHGGNSEAFLGRVLKDGYRERVKLATKLPIWSVQSKADCEKYLREQLDKLDTNHVDFYLVHALNKERWDTVLRHDVLSFLDDAKSSGLIKHAGFSYHEDISFFRTILDAYDWSMCQLQINYMEDPAWLEEIKYAASKGIGVVVMEPLLGGKLAGEPPEDVKHIWNQADIKRSPAEWALRWVYDLPEVSLVLSGMSTLEQVMENIVVSDSCEPGSLTPKELSLVQKVREVFKERIKVKCTECGYCLAGCPSNVHIFACFYYYNDAVAFNRYESARKGYNSFKNKNNAAACIECGKCEETCPQKLPIMKLLKEANELLSQ
ncbi:MAG: aldo/keto reductase [Bacillota bacterium]